METKSSVPTGILDPCILLGGQPRSGTTLLSSILRASRGHFQAFELHIRKPSFLVGLNGRYTRNIFKELGLPPEEYERIIKSFDKSKMNLGAWVGPKEDVSAEDLSGKETINFEDEFIARGCLVSFLMRRVAQLNRAKTWGFKILGDIIYADRYSQVWPNAIFILMLRDPRDQALSVMKLNDQRSMRGQQNFYDDYTAVANGWRETIQQGIKVLRALGLSYIIVRYEDLVSNPQTELDRLSKAVGFDLMEGLDFHKQNFIQNHTRRFKHHHNLKNPINTGSVEKWRREMTVNELKLFEDLAGDVMAEFGYL